jgi:DnaK suppressor protein
MTTRSMTPRAGTRHAPAREHPPPAARPADEQALLRTTLVRQLEAEMATAREHEAVSENLTGHHDVDSLLERELAIDLAARSRATINEIRDALARLDAGTYGICEGCGDAIPAARLEVIPQARTCVSCPAPT